MKERLSVDSHTVAQFGSVYREVDQIKSHRISLSVVIEILKILKTPQDCDIMEGYEGVGTTWLSLLIIP